MTQWQLIRSRRFVPLFCTQFLNAFNDNIYKNALVILIIFQGNTLYGIDTTVLVTLCAGFFILPYFLFSATAGQFADKYEKSRLIQRVKLIEIFIMGVAVIGFYSNNIILLIILLFMLGTQAAMFSPLKYGILPQHLDETELIGGNGLINMGTFLAILLGTILGGILISIPDYGTTLISMLIILLAVLGYTASLFILPAQPSESTLKIHWSLAIETWKMIRYGMENRSVFIAILAMSWFWFVGATYLSQMPAYAKYVLGGNNEVVTLLLTMFSVGIGTGSVLCEKLSKGHIELGIVPIGALGITVFAIDVYFASQPLMQAQVPVGSQGLWQFLAMSGSGRALIDLILIGFFGGIYIVPLNAMIQHRSNPLYRSRIIASNNILNALMMVASSVVTIMMLQYQFNIAEIFLSLGVVNILVALAVFSAMPEFIERLRVWLHYSTH
ncbi:MAG: MFS transporter [Thiotrichaceae bacterium]